MRYISIDIETTGLRLEDGCQVVEIGAILETGDGTPIPELPSFRALLSRAMWNVTPYCLNLHQRLWKEMTSEFKEVRAYGHWNLLCLPEDVAAEFSRWLNWPHDQKITVAGKNFASFDAPFLRDLGFPAFRHMVLDPAMLFVLPEDEKLPGLLTCCERAGVEVDESRTHTALYDAELVIRVLRAGGICTQSI